MQTVSTEYKEQIDKQLRNVSYIKVNLGVVNVNATRDDTISTNGEVYFSKKDLIDVSESINKVYHTMEHNRFILDSNNLLPPEIGDAIPYKQGFVSTSISGADGTFSVNPVITIDFLNPLNFIGLVFRFDKILGCYASELQVQALLNNVEVYNSTIYPDSPEYLLETPIPSLEGTCDKLILTFKKTYPAKRRARLDYILFGLVKEFSDTTITTATWNRNIDLLTSKISVNSFNFTAIDLDKDYNPDNASGFWKYIEKRQPVTWQYGYELDDNSIEWINGGKLFTDGDIKVDSSGAISTVSFNSTSILNQMTENYYKGVYSAIPVSLYSLAEDVFEYANSLNYGISYSIDSSLNNIYTSLPVGDLPINQALQLIANAGMCVLYVDRDGVITIKSITDVLQDFSLNFSNMTSTPAIEKVPALMTVTTSFGIPSIGTVSEVLMSTESLTFSTNTDVRLSYDESTECSIVTTGTMTVVGSPVFYAKYCDVVLIGSGTVSISGKKIIRNTTEITYVVSDKGYDCPIENSLINTEEDAIAYAEWIASILTRRNQYTVSDRGYPELDVLDLINVDTLFSTNLEATVTGIKLKYSGALSSETLFLSKEVT